MLVFPIGGELPATKIAALQKVLQSDFLNAVREVYEHVYETLDIQVTLTFSLPYNTFDEINVTNKFLFDPRDHKM